MNQPTAREGILQVLDAAEGFFPSSVLFALMRLGVLEQVGDGPATAEQVADKLGARPESVARLLNAGTMLHILEHHDGVYGVAGPFRSMLLPGEGPLYMADWVLNLEYFRDALAHLDQAVLTSRPAATFVDDAHGGDQQHTRLFIKAMHNYALFAGRELACRLDLTGITSLLEIGAGPGTYSFHLAEANPDVQLHLADLPEVLEVTREIETSFRLAKRPEYLSVDLRTDPVGGAYDVVLLSNTLHMLGEKASRSLLATAYDLVAPGGSVVVQAQFLDEGRQGPRWPVLLDVIQLCITESGRNHTVGETQVWLTDAGFTDVEHDPMSPDNVNGYVRAWKR